MRKLIESTLVSLDAVVESPERWVQTHWDNEVKQYALSQLSEFDAFLMGRVTYENLYANWPVSAILVTVDDGSAPIVYGNQEYTARPIVDIQPS